MSPEEIKKAMTRREFFAGMVPVLSIPVLFWWLLTGKRSGLSETQNKVVEISGDIPVGTSFHKDVILVNDGKSKMAFRAKCTHLGCSIKKLEGDQLVCACHGSRFGLDGKVISGPAREPLEMLTISADPLSGNLKIRGR
jgi:Rieske Fe-S protein